MSSKFLYVLSVLVAAAFTACTGQIKTKDQTQTDSLTGKAKLVGGGCDGCELMYIDMPATIHSVDTSIGWKEKGQKFIITGTVYKLNGKTPAENVIIYYYHTDSNGYYSPKNGMNEKAKRHGHIRGWVKSDEHGRYSIYTIRPAPYPGNNIPAHIHISIKEPGIANEYYIDELIFDDDKLLTPEKIKKLEDRGGSGVLHVVFTNGLQRAEHDIILGFHIPGYPEAKPD